MTSTMAVPAPLTLTPMQRHHTLVRAFRTLDDDGMSNLRYHQKRDTLVLCGAKSHMFIADKGG